MAVEAAYVSVDVREGIRTVTRKAQVKDPLAGFGARCSEATLLTRLMAVLLAACGEEADDEAVQRLGKPLKRCFRLLHACLFGVEDLELMAAHACVYFDVLVNQLRAACQQVYAAELIYIYCILLFIAHSYVEDRNCPLRYWHRCAFKNYCELKTLNAAIMETMRKLDYKLRVSPEELELQVAQLRAADDQQRALIRAALRRGRKLQRPALAA